ncbi:MAG: guanylate kinase [Clostridia bacterium]|nr:guanylate kinase [Clostridia bacterium]
MSNKKCEKGTLLVISGPSGVGKGTVLAELMKKSEDYAYSVSATTRAPREGEQEGKNYFFKTKEEFEQMIENGELLEYASYNGNYYGTPKKYVDKMLASGKNVILEIEVQGAMKVKKLRPDAVMVFIAPESKDVLYERLSVRATEPKDVIINRIEIAERELRACPFYDYVTVNADGKADKCAEDIMAAVRAEKLKPEKMFGLISEFI